MATILWRPAARTGGFAAGGPRAREGCTTGQPSPHDTPPHGGSGGGPGVPTAPGPRKLGPARLGPVLGLPAPTVHRILVRHGLNRRAFMDRPTGQVIRRYERDQPGELIHVDVKMLGHIPDGGGNKVLGARGNQPCAQRSRGASVRFRGGCHRACWPLGAHHCLLRGAA